MTLPKDFDRVVLRNKIYCAVEGLQPNLDSWMADYTEVMHATPK